MVTAVWCIFGPSVDASQQHVQSLCDVKDLPHISTVNRRHPPTGRAGPTPSHTSVNLFPPSNAVNKALIGAIHYYHWSSVVVLYEASGDLLDLEEIITMSSAKRPSPVKGGGDSDSTTLEDVPIALTIRQLPTNGAFMPLLKVPNQFLCSQLRFLGTSP